MILITCVDTSGGNAGLGYGNESKTRIYTDKATALNEAFRWYTELYKSLEGNHSTDMELLSREQFLSGITDPENSYVTVQYEDFHIQFEYSETGITSYLAEAEKETKYYDVYFQFKPLVKVVEAKSREEAEQIVMGWDDTSLPKDELIERFLAAVADTDYIKVCDVIEAPVIGESLLQPIL